jgi:hypothetical protein
MIQTSHKTHMLDTTAMLKLMKTIYESVKEANHTSGIPLHSMLSENEIHRTYTSLVSPYSRRF